MSALVAKELQEQNKLLEQLIGNYILDKIHPVGSIYISENSTSPATLFGGTWERVKDRFLLAAGDTYSAGSIGGEATHKLTVGEMPAHRHNYLLTTSDDGDVQKWFPSGSEFQYGKYQDQSYMLPTGGNQPHNNMPPYLAVYMWKRIA